MIDCGFVDRVNRNAYLSEELGRKIKYLDELKTDEASRIINQLRLMKDENWEKRAKDANE